MSLRISVTTLEQYRLWSQPDQEWMPESELIDSIKGVFVPNRKMLVGQAFGRCIEKADKYRRVDSQGEYYAVPVKVAGKWEEYIFKGSTINPCLAKFDRRGVFEVKQVKNYGGVNVVTKADQVLGTRIIENKLKVDGTFDFDKYDDSYQWRFMLDMFGASQVTYNVFRLTDDSAEADLKDVDTFNEFPYPSLHDDCCDLLTRFLGYVAARQLEPFLQEKEYVSA